MRTLKIRSWEVPAVLMWVSLLAFLFLSYLTMIEAVSGPKLRVPLFAISVVLSLGIFIIEYFAGLELLRPVLLGIVLYAQSPELKRLLRRVLVYWIPYLLVFIGFVVWRVFILMFPSYKPGLVYDLSANPLGALVQLAAMIMKDLYTVTIGAWIQIFQIAAISRTSLLYLAIVLAAFISVVAFLLWINKRLTGQEIADKRRLRNWSFITGIYALLVGGWPTWVPKIPVTLTFAWDRATLPFIFGVSLIVPGLANLLPWHCLQIIVLAILVSLSVGLMFQNANLFRKEFTILKQFYWELSWRAPGLKTGTGVVIEESHFNYHVDTSLTPLLYWTYAPQSSSTNLPYEVLEYHKIATKYSTNLKKNVPLHQSFFNYDFNSLSSSIVLVAFDPPGCLRVLPLQDGDQLLLPAGFKQELYLSNPSLILDNENSPAQPPAVLGGSSDHDWCYYFEKADLAGQQGNWEEVVTIEKEAMQASLKPHYPSELAVFIEGFAHTGVWSQAHELARTMVKDAFFKPAACDTWNNLEQDMLTSPLSFKILSGHKIEFGCNS